MTLHLLPAPDRVQTSSGDVFSAALRGEPCRVIGLSREPVMLPMARWADDADESDSVLLDHCLGPTIDVGCGPGRMSHELTQRGVCALGIDVVFEAVAQTRARGAAAILRDVFDRVPGEGRWHTALLADGNIGIGGDPVRLLGRLATIIGEHGRIVVDLAAPGCGLVTRTLRLQVGGRRSAPFTWSVLAAEGLPAVAEAAGLQVAVLAQHEGRWFAVLRSPGERHDGRRA